MATPSAAGASLQKASRLRRTPPAAPYPANEFAGLLPWDPAGGRLGRSASPSRPLFGAGAPLLPQQSLPLPAVATHKRYARLACGAFVPPLFPPAFLPTPRPHSARVAALACRVRSGAARPPRRRDRCASPRLQSCPPCAGFRPPWWAAPPAAALPLGLLRAPCVGWSPSAAAAGFGVAALGGRRLPLACPLRGFGSLRLLPRGHRRLSAAFFSPLPPGLCCARAAPACCRSVAAAVIVAGFSPAPSRPAAPAGGSGKRRASFGCAPLPSPAPFHCSAWSSPSLWRLRRT